MPRRVHASAPLLPLLLLLSTSPLAAAECGWLATSEVDAALPAVAPWSVMVGGAAGSCKFVSAGLPNIFGANQMVKASAKEAASFVRGLRPEMEKSYVVAPAKDIGAEGFTYRPKDDTLSDRSIFFVGHEGRIAVIASLTLQKAVTAADIAGATKLIRAALAIDKDPAALAAATSCPWFDTAVLKKLLPGEGFSQQSFGNNSCMAQAGGSVVIVSIIPGLDPADVRRTSGGQCKREAVAALGPD